MFEKLESVVDKYDELTKLVANPDVIANQSVWQKHMKELGEIEPVWQEQERLAGAKLAVELGPLINFFPAEEYHQHYLDKNPGGYCHIPAALFTRNPD